MEASLSPTMAAAMAAAALASGGGPNTSGNSRHVRQPLCNNRSSSKRSDVRVLEHEAEMQRLLSNTDR